jgi:hypothetical protein
MALGSSERWAPNTCTARLSGELLTLARWVLGAPVRSYVMGSMRRKQRFCSGSLATLDGGLGCWWRVWCSAACLGSAMTARGWPRVLGGGLGSRRREVLVRGIWGRRRQDLEAWVSVLVVGWVGATLQRR